MFQDLLNLNKPVGFLCIATMSFNLKSQSWFLKQFFFTSFLLISIFFAVFINHKLTVFVFYLSHLTNTLVLITKTWFIKLQTIYVIW